jgi:hypothetical protein
MESAATPGAFARAGAAGAGRRSVLRGARQPRSRGARRGATRPRRERHPAPRRRRSGGDDAARRRPDPGRRLGAARARRAPGDALRALPAPRRSPASPPAPRSARLRARPGRRSRSRALRPHARRPGGSRSARLDWTVHARAGRTTGCSPTARTGSTCITGFYAPAADRRPGRSPVLESRSGLSRAARVATLAAGASRVRRAVAPASSPRRASPMPDAEQRREDRERGGTTAGAAPAHLRVERRPQHGATTPAIAPMRPAGTQNRCRAPSSRAS